MGLVITSLDKLPDDLYTQGVDAIRWHMNRIRSRADARRGYTITRRAANAQPAPARTRQPRPRQRPAAQQPAARPSWYL